MVLVDTSVWLRFLARREPWRAQADHLLARDQISGHDLVEGELLMGDRGGRRDLMSIYSLLDRLPSVPHEEVIHLARARKLHGRGIGWIDAHLLASALASGATLFTADDRLAAVAGELGAGYSPRD